MSSSHSPPSRRLSVRPFDRDPNDVPETGADLTDGPILALTKPIQYYYCRSLVRLRHRQGAINGDKLHLKSTTRVRSVGWG